MMLFANATRRPRRAGWIATAAAASLIFGAACSSKSDADPEYPDPPPAQTGTEQPTGEEHAAPAEPPGAAQPGAAQPGGEQPQPAQQPGAEQPGHAQGAPAQGGDVSDEEVTRFVAAYSSIMELQAGYQQEFQGAETPEEAQEIEQRAQEEVSEAIEDAGLTPQRFDEIARQVQMDPELQQRVQQELGGPGQP